MIIIIVFINMFVFCYILMLWSYNEDFVNCYSFMFIDLYLNDNFF